MSSEPNPLPRRKSPRLQGYDYSQEGAYFVTICTHNRFHHFGVIKNEAMHLHDWGQIAETCWLAIPKHYPQVELDDYVVMPNHIHGILLIINDQPIKPNKSPNLGTIIGTYKAAVTRQVNTSNGKLDIPLWQTRYHDHIIRNEPSLNYIRRYIQQNPSRWEEDTFYS